MSEMSHEDAVQALSAAAAIDPDFGGTAPAPAEQAVQPTQPVATPEGENAPAPVEEQPAAPAEAEAVDSFSERFNPDTLPPELVPAWRQLQADYTQKTQAIAEQRRQFEQLGDPDMVSQAVELYDRISDPANWAQLHQELSEAMVEAGLTPAEADALAAEELSAQAQGPSGLEGLDLDDPELAPLVAALKQTETRSARVEQQLQALLADQQAQAEHEEAERAHQAHVLEMQRQVGAIRQANPHYDEEDIKDVVKLAPFFNDDLFAAQQAFEASYTRRLERYFSTKQSAQTPSIQPQPGAGLESVQDREIESIRDAEEEAVEYIRGLQAEGLLDV